MKCSTVVQPHVGVHFEASVKFNSGMRRPCSQKIKTVKNDVALRAAGSWHDVSQQAK